MVSDGPGIIQSMRDTGMITLNILQEVQSIFISELDPDKNVTSLSLSEIIPNPTRTHLYDWCSLQMEQCARAWSLTTGNDPGMPSLDVTPPSCPHLLHSRPQSRMSHSQHHRIIIKGWQSLVSPQAQHFIWGHRVILNFTDWLPPCISGQAYK